MLKISIIVGTLITGIGAAFWGFSREKDLDTPDVFSSEEIVWMGLDFTRSHFVGNFDQGFGFAPATPEELRDKWIPSWNNLIPAEQDNFDLRRTFRKRYVYYDINPVNELNSKIMPRELINFNEARIDREAVQEMVKRYPAGNKKEGLGLVFIIENFNKNTTSASMYITFFDLSTRKVLLCEYGSAEPIGFGLRNYWAGAIKEVLVQTEYYDYPKWKKRYGRSSDNL